MKEELLYAVESYEKAVPKDFCKVNLKPLKGEDFVDVAFFSDLHIGSRFCDFKEVVKMRDFFLENNIHVLLGGDLIEGSTKTSIGAGIYEQVLTPTEQFHSLMSFFEPLAKKGLLISAIRGNHENRFWKTVGIDITSIMCDHLDIPYLGVGGFNFISVGKTTYSVYYMHGNGVGKYFHTKAKKVQDGARFTNCDVYAWGHVHELGMWHVMDRECTNKKGVFLKDKLLIMSGHYLKHQQSYADEAAMPPSRMGSPIVRLFSKTKKVSEYII